MRCVSGYACMRVCTSVPCVCKCMCARVNGKVCVCACVFVCTCACMCVCLGLCAHNCSWTWCRQSEGRPVSWGWECLVARSATAWRGTRQSEPQLQTGAHGGLWSQARCVRGRARAGTKTRFSERSVLIGRGDPRQRGTEASVTVLSMVT